MAVGWPVGRPWYQLAAGRPTGRPLGQLRLIMAYDYTLTMAVGRPIGRPMTITLTMAITITMTIAITLTIAITPSLLLLLLYADFKTFCSKRNFFS